MNLFSSQTEESFSFLVSNYGFTNPIATDGSWKTTFLYENKEIVIEIELNYKDMDVFVFITQTENKKLSNQAIKYHLEELINKNRIKSNGNQTTIEQFEKTIYTKADLLQSHVEGILANQSKKEAIQKR
ncbi:hypothetical protein [Fictibacillus barbaricus]|uniref:DUF1828 domain-containing protein n=1 Tax=Fictibacillus barbaricus TaxID=182136 RepID=A0ABU1U1P3_9BACL|nr:hypothetical protein [Fictibacillus barbaricus]MDR7073387.1 hypothetical protein [Fictibacillus barbaricus]